MGCGSTALTAVLRDNSVYVTWLGDSQALLVRNGQPVEIMNPHKPDREVRRERNDASEYLCLRGGDEKQSSRVSNDKSIEGWSS